MISITHIYNKIIILNTVNFINNLFTTLNLQNYVITKYVSIHMSTLVTYYYDDAEATDFFLNLEHGHVFAFG